MWTELSRVAAYGANETERAARILLLAPICVDGVHGSKLAAAVKEALAVYRVPGDTGYLAELLVGRPEDWAAYPAWEESEGIRSFPGRGSRRNRHSGLLTEEQHRSVARILS
ncbi:MAG TPA: hypothetical protein VLH10_28300 [Yinghuangia sp.]|nr:hypothetical protein [Yinghuangia sp.]